MICTIDSRNSRLQGRASKEYLKKSNFEYETATHCVLEFEYGPEYEQNMNRKKIALLPCLAWQKLPGYLIFYPPLPTMCVMSHEFHNFRVTQVVVNIHTIRAGNIVTVVPE